jgi:hypothetical protein
MTEVFSQTFTIVNGTIKYIFHGAYNEISTNTKLSQCAFNELSTNTNIIHGAYNEISTNTNIIQGAYNELRDVEDLMIPHSYF